MNICKRLIALVCAGLMVYAGVYADEAKKPAYQIADNTFFDPTAKTSDADEYHFGMEYRLEVGYVQHEQRTKELSYPGMYLHGGRVGVTFTFLLPIHFSLQTGLLYTITYGQNTQHWRSMDVQSVQEEYIKHKVLEHNLTIPLRLYYTVPLWKKLSLFFYTGPQLHIGLSEYDNLETHISEGVHTWLTERNIPTEPYERFSDELYRANIQWGLGGGLEWDCYRLQSGYDFGLNNLVHHKRSENQYMSEWGWFITFSYRF